MNSGKTMPQETTMTIRNDVLILELDGRRQEISIYSEEGFRLLNDLWIKSGWHQRFSYTFTWMGRPVIQLPDDIMSIQEIIFKLQPDVIIETGIAHGGSLIFYASLCKVLGKGRVIGVDIEIRPHNRTAIETHPLFPYITLIEGDSVAPEIVDKVKAEIEPGDVVLIILDSNHSKNHVLSELNAYSPLVTTGSYIIATDGIMQNLHDVPGLSEDWIWNNPQEAAREFLKHNSNFVLENLTLNFDESNIHVRNTYWPHGLLKRI
jgi:cephalosporin hydroxylase